MIQLQNFIKHSMLMRSFTFWQDNFCSAPPEWIQQFVESIQHSYAKIIEYMPRDWNMWNEGNVIAYTDGYNQGLLESHDNGWDQAKEYNQKVFGRQLRHAKYQWKEEGSIDEYSEEIIVEYEESDKNDEWSSYGQKRDSK